MSAVSARTFWRSQCRQDACAPSRSSSYQVEMNSRKIFRVVVQICRFALAALFLFTAGAKIAIAKAFAANVGELLAASGFNHLRWMWPVTIVVIVVEIITATLLLVPRTVRPGALIGGLLLVGFAGYAL